MLLDCLGPFSDPHHLRHRTNNLMKRERQKRLSSFCSIGYQTLQRITAVLRQLSLLIALESNSIFLVIRVFFS